MSLNPRSQSSGLGEIRRRSGSNLIRPRCRAEWRTEVVPAAWPHEGCKISYPLRPHDLSNIKPILFRQIPTHISQLADAELICHSGSAGRVLLALFASQTNCLFIRLGALQIYRRSRNQRPVHKPRSKVEGSNSRTYSYHLLRESLECRCHYTLL